MSRTCLLLLLVIPNALPTASVASVRLEQTDIYSFPNAAAPLVFTLINDGVGGTFPPGETLLDLSRQGVPSTVRIEVVTPDGVNQTKQIPQSEAGHSGGPGAVKTEDMFLLKPRDSVRLEYDLARLFDFNKPGVYKVRIYEMNREAARTEVRILNRANAKSVPFAGVTAFPPKLWNLVDWTMVVEGSVSYGSSNVGGKTLGFLTVENVKIGDGLQKRTFKPVGSAPDVVVERAELDFAWQLWLLLESHGQRSVLIWNILTDEQKTLIPWTREKIEMGTSVTLGGSISPIHSQTVLAGVQGQTKTSTLSLDYERRTKQ